MSHGTLEAICICAVARQPMISVPEVRAIAGAGLEGDRYASGTGSFGRKTVGVRQVTLINGIFLRDSGWEYVDTRRNLGVTGIELMYHIGKIFQIGEVVFRGVEYLDPCTIPNRYGRPELKEAPLFCDVFHDCGGLIAEIIKGGVLRVGDPAIPAPKNYKEK